MYVNYYDNVKKDEIKSTESFTAKNSVRNVNRLILPNFTFVSPKRQAICQPKHTQIYNRIKFVKPANRVSKRCLSNS